MVLKKFFNKLTKYEKTWYFTVLAASGILAVILPEEDVNGRSGVLIMALYLINTFLNVTCELMISKQDKYNFIVSLFIEVSEIAIYILLSYRFATMLTTLLFWIPIDVISFIAWSRHPDRDDGSLTQVRSLTPKQDVLFIAGVIVWTAAVGSVLVYVTENIAPSALFDGRRNVEIIVCYLDAMISALDIANGTFILLRYKEQWFAWYLEVILDAICLILAGQYLPLVLTAAYLTNTTYGFIRWSRYAKNAQAGRHKTVQVQGNEDS